ncbi:nickel pincer cofactor biosynthesis protein LarC [Prochlorococcus marinus]|uniref:Putative nickel insertion protein n=1 Tax=Prochlorococcus marinus (strain MIT 9211) TaxID=93059 RepID=A9BEA9_PROM4|nr:nickel pincer cofactor biosynthesis protein LarC [Prochlorococcus marinus]ABX08419.1 Conserved hypothetical protein [Prochlorococcus marinus str. MIT 9211]
MKELFIDCPTGLSGDMLLGALFDLGTPQNVITRPLAQMGLGEKYSLDVKETKTYGLRGKRVFIKALEAQPKHRRWAEIRNSILEATMESNLQEKVLMVFEILAEAEASVHGINIDQVEFHEIGSIDTLVDVVGVCSAIDHLDLERVYCAAPPGGKGFIETAHGALPVPVPAVLELAKKHQIKLLSEINQPSGELTTPTGLALMIVLADEFTRPQSLCLESIGVGCGSRTLDRPNVLRACLLDSSESNTLASIKEDFYWEQIVTQEAWVDDASPEDISILIHRLREAGALDVTSHSIQMKKGRNGQCIKALLRPKDVGKFRSIWFLHGTTIGFRESLDGRWLLPRRSGTCLTIFGKIRVKQVRRPDGNISMKIEHDDLTRISLETGLSFDEIRTKVISESSSFSPTEEWSE